MTENKIELPGGILAGESILRGVLACPAGFRSRDRGARGDFQPDFANWGLNLVELKKGCGGPTGPCSQFYFPEKNPSEGILFSLPPGKLPPVFYQEQAPCLQGPAGKEKLFFLAVGIKL